MSNLPDDIISSLLSIGRVEWGSTAEQSDEAHVEDFKNTLRLTREYFKTGEIQALHGLYLEGENVVVCHTGTSPNSPQHARILAGAWNQLVDLAEASARENATAPEPLSTATQQEK